MRSWLVWCWGWKLGLLGAAAPGARGFKVRVLRWRSGERCVSSGEWCCVSSGWSNRRSRSTQSTRMGSLTLALFLGAVRCVSGAGLMAAICLPGEVRRPVPGCYLPGGALGVLSCGSDASLTADGTPKRVLLFIPGTYKVVPGLTPKKKCVPKVLPLKPQSQKAPSLTPNPTLNQG